MAKYLSERLSEQWIIETLERRERWLTARCAVKEDRGDAVNFDRTERDALRRILASKPDPDLAVLRAEITRLREKIQRQRTGAIQNHARIFQLEECLREHGIEIPMGENA